MELDPKTFAILSLIFIILFRLIWNLLGGLDDKFDEFWKELNWKGDETIEDEEENDRPKSGKK